MLISVSKSSLQIANRNLSNFNENSVISFRIEIRRRSNALPTPFYTPNVLHVDFSVESISRKPQSFKFRRKLWYFVPDWDTTAFKRSFHSILHAQCSACRFQCRNNPCKSQNAIFQISTKSLSFHSGLRYYDVQALLPLHSTCRTYFMWISVSKTSLEIAKRKLSNFDENFVISFRIEMFRSLRTLFTPFYTPNVLHVDFSVETIIANRKTQSFKFRRKLCYFVPDWYITAFERSFHSILQAERIGMWISVSKTSQKIAKRRLSNFDENIVISYLIEIFRNLRALSTSSTRRTYCILISVSKPSLQIAKRNLSNFDENSVISFLIEMLRRLCALFTPFYTPNVVHVDFSVATIPANRKTQSFKFRRKLCYFVPDWVTTAIAAQLPSVEYWSLNMRSCKYYVYGRDRSTHNVNWRMCAVFLTKFAV
jgi:hypothetical protein